MPLEIVLGQLLRAHRLKLATAESCTGGLIADKITDVPGSSEYFIGGFVSYAYEAKVASLGVSWDTLQKYGAVSRETVLEMARGARTALGADIALAVSGIAGPGGGLPEKPVGTTWIGLVTDGFEHAEAFYWRGNRRENKEQSAQQAMRMAIEHLKSITGES
ncbi:MAG: CinA family protein [Anaerolineaceae bacterium]|nr:MAG: CinA family protein [Anaerolineaceae bacterium]